MRFTPSTRSGNMFQKGLNRRTDNRSMSAIGRSLSIRQNQRDMSGEGILDTLRSVFNKGQQIYRQAKPYAEKAVKAYKKYKPQAEKAYKVYKSDEFQKYVPDNIKRKEEKFAKTVKEKYKMANDLYEDVNNFGSSIRNGLDDIEGMKGMKMKGLKKTKEKAPADDLRNSLLSQIRSGKKTKDLRVNNSFVERKEEPSQPSLMDNLKMQLAARRQDLEGNGIYPAGFQGSGLNPPGYQGSGLNPPGIIMGAGNMSSIMKIVGKAIPMLVDKIQKGKGLSDMQARKLLTMSMMKAKPILSGMSQKGTGIGDMFKSLGNALITPLNIISNISDSSKERQSGSGAKKKLIMKKYKKYVVKMLAKKMKGGSFNFGDVLSGLSRSAEQILPHIL